MGGRTFLASPAFAIRRKSGWRAEGFRLTASRGSPPLRFHSTCVVTAAGETHSPRLIAEHQFDAIVNAELLIDIREMVLHGVLADATRRCDVFVWSGHLREP